MGPQQSCELGLGDRQFCFLGGYWTRRHTNFGDLISVPTKVAHIDKSIRRSHDHFRRDVCPAVSHDSRRAYLDYLLHAADSHRSVP